MATRPRAIMVITHSQLLKRGGPLPVKVRSPLREGGEGEPELYIELEPETYSGDDRVLLALDHPRLITQVANAKLRVGAPYVMRANGTPDAPRLTFQPLPNTGPFPVDEVDLPRCSAEDLFTAALTTSIAAQERAERITGRTMSPEAQALAVTLLISHLKDRSGILQASQVEHILKTEEAIERGESGPLFEADTSGSEIKRAS